MSSKTSIVLGLLLAPMVVCAWSVGIYDSETDQSKATVVFTCDKKIFRLTMNKGDIETKYSEVESWVLDMKKTCNER
jgi:hypothetical protein